MAQLFLVVELYAGASAKSVVKKENHLQVSPLGIELELYTHLVGPPCPCHPFGLLKVQNLEKRLQLWTRPSHYPREV